MPLQFGQHATGAILRQSLALYIGRWMHHLQYTMIWRGKGSHQWNPDNGKWVSVQHIHWKEIVTVYDVTPQVIWIMYFLEAGIDDWARKKRDISGDPRRQMAWFCATFTSSSWCHQMFLWDSTDYRRGRDLEIVAECCIDRWHCTIHKHHTRCLYLWQLLSIGNNIWDLSPTMWFPRYYSPPHCSFRQLNLTLAWQCSTTNRLGCLTERYNIWMILVTWLGTFFSSIPSVWATHVRICFQSKRLDWTLHIQCINGHRVRWNSLGW